MIFGIDPLVLGAAAVALLLVAAIVRRVLAIVLAASLLIWGTDMLSLDSDIWRQPLTERANGALLWIQQGTAEVLISEAFRTVAGAALLVGLMLWVFNTVLSDDRRTK